MQRRRLLTILALVVGALSACSDAVAPLGSIEVEPGPTIELVAVGATVQLVATVRDVDGVAVTSASVTWSSGRPEVASVGQSGLVVARSNGSAVVTATSGSLSADVTVVVAHDQISNGGVFEPVGSGFLSERATSDIWLYGDYAYTGTFPRSGCSSSDSCGNLLVTWDVSDPSAPVRRDTLRLDATVVNDVKVNADGTLLVATHEGSSDTANGVTFLGLADPAHPSVIARYTDGLESGVHNVWLERIAGRDYLFAVTDGATPEHGLKIVDVTNPAGAFQVASFYAGSSFAHDVYVRDGLAFVSHWDAGLVILDVGNGIRGGAPERPREVSRIVTRGGSTHNAWYWPERAVVFVGQEEGPPPGQPIDSIGVVHVVDVSDLTAPEEVATVFTPQATPHSFWVDENAGVLFVAWYQAGLRAVDVNGVLAGRLEQQDRVLAIVRPTGPGGPSSMWGPQLHRGLVYVSDIRNGFWVYRFQPDS